MKKILSIIACLALFAGYGSCSDPYPADDGGGTEVVEPEPPEEPEEPEEPELELNAALTEALAGLYSEFGSTDLVPKTMTVDGVTFQKGKYYEAAAKLLVNFSKGVNEELILVNMSTPSSPSTLDTFVEDEIPLELLVDQSRRQLDYAAGHGNVYANYVSYPQSFLGPNGEKYNGQLSFDRSAVLLLRVIAHYKEHGEFPARLSSWHSDFLRSTKNCNISSGAVTSALAAAVAGKTTVRQRAEGIFQYVRDRVEYDYYNNSKHGAAGTLTGAVGNCCDTSHALIAMARAAGIPSRYVHADATYPSGSVFGHVWAELWVDGRWWLCDATGKGNTFGNHENWSTFVLKAKHRELQF